MRLTLTDFRVGQLVRWSSASRGVWRHRVGVVVAEVPADGRPLDCLPGGAWTVCFRGELLRPEASFLVALQASRRLYHPRLSALLPYEAAGSEPSSRPVRPYARIRRNRALVPVAVAARAWGGRWRRPGLILARLAVLALFAGLLVGLGAIP